MSTVGKTLCKILNDRMETMLERDQKISEGQAGFQPNRSRVDHLHILGKTFQGRKDAWLTTYCFFLDVQKACGAVWRNELWEKMGNGDQRKDVENDENYDGMNEKCCDAGRGNIQIC